MARCPHIMRVEERKLELDGYSSSMKIITIENENANDSGDKARLLINFGEHGRELISPEIALEMLDTLCDSDKRTSMLQAQDIDAESVEDILDKVIIKIIPVENPRGRELVEGGALCERKNGRGVDPNRNWAVHWGYKEKDYDPEEEYPGKKPFSEPETAMMKALAEDFRPHLWLNVHSGMEAMFLPYDHKNEVPQGDAAEATLQILKTLNEKVCDGRCAVGPGGKTVGYLAHGTATDYMHDVLGVGLVMTWEVYGDEKAAYIDCFRMFNPLSLAAFESVVNQWTGAVYALIAALPGHPSMPALLGGRSTDVDGEDEGDGAKLALGRKGGGGAKGRVGDREPSSTTTATTTTSKLKGVGGGSKGASTLLGEQLAMRKRGHDVVGYSVLAVACVLYVAYFLAAISRRRARMGGRRSRSRSSLSVV